MNKKAKPLSQSLKILILLLILGEVIYLTGYVLGVGVNPNNGGVSVDLPLSASSYEASSHIFQDISGWNNYAYSTNIPVFSADKYGKSQSSMYFNGVSDQLSINSSNSFKKPSLTVAFWVNPQNEGKRHVIVTTWPGFTTEINPDGTFKWGLYGPSKQYYGSKTIPWNEWSYVTGTFDDDSKQQCIYINGVLQQCQTVTGSINYGSGNLYVYGSWGKSKAEVNNVKIYSRSLSASEVKELYNSYLPRIKLPSLESGLISYWPLNTNNYNPTSHRITDMSAYSNHATNYGATFTTDRSQREGGAMSFATAGQKIVSPFKTSDYFSDGSEFTLSTWIKIRDYPTSGLDRTGILGSNQWNGGGFGLVIDHNGIRMITGNETNTTEHSVPLSNFPLDTWHHIVFKYGDGMMTMYKNGEQIAQTNRGSWSVNNLDFTIGYGTQGGWNRTFQGDIAETRIYNRALSDMEVEALFDKDIPKLAFNPISKGLMLDYIFDWEHLEPGRPLSWFVDRQQGYYAGNYGTQMPEDYADFSDYAHVDIPHNEMIDTESLSLIFWVKHRDYTYPKTFGAITKSSPSCYQDGGIGWDFGHGYKITGVDVCVNDGSHKVRDTLDFDIGSRPAGLLNTWVQLAYVIDRDANRVYAYVNGVKQEDEVDISIVTGSIRVNTDIILGALYGWYIDGNVKSLKIYNHALSASDIQLIYDQDMGRSGIILRGMD